jgi:hypothetical protein
MSFNIRFTVWRVTGPVTDLFRTLETAGPQKGGHVVCQVPASNSFSFFWIKSLMVL